MSGWHHDNANWTPKKCAVCSTEFVPKSGVHKFCSDQCKGKWKYVTGVMTTENQYRKISGNWTRYYQRLLNGRGRKGDGLTLGFLLELHKRQEGLCALSGLPLTCDLSRGIINYTNASIDRIKAGGPYSPDNVRLVCRHVNSWRGMMPTEVFVAVCAAVVRHHSEDKDGET